MELKCKPWSALTADERAIFVTHLNQPDERLDRAIIGRSGQKAPSWIARPLDPATVEYMAGMAEAIGERLAIQELARREYKHRTVWCRRP